MNIFKKIIHSFLPIEKQEELRLLDIANTFIQSHDKELNLKNYQSFKEYRNQHGTLIHYLLNSKIPFEDVASPIAWINIQDLTDMFKYSDMYSPTNISFSAFSDICAHNKTSNINIPQHILNELIEKCHENIDLKRNPLNIRSHINIIARNNTSENLNFNREQIMRLARISTPNFTERYTDRTTLGELITHNESEKLGLNTEDFLELLIIHQDSITLTKEHFKEINKLTELDFLIQLEQIQLSNNEKEAISQELPLLNLNTLNASTKLNNKKI